MIGWIDTSMKFSGLMSRCRILFRWILYWQESPNTKNLISLHWYAVIYAHLVNCQEHILPVTPNDQRIQTERENEPWLLLLVTTSERVTECKSDQETLVTLSWSVRPIPLITSTFSGCQWWCAGQRLPCQHHRHYQHCHRYHRLAKGSFQKLLSWLGVVGEGTPIAGKKR